MLMPGHRVDIGYDLLGLRRWAGNPDADIAVVLRRDRRLSVVRTDLPFLSRPGGVDAVVKAVQDRIDGGRVLRVCQFGFGDPVVEVEDRMWVLRGKLGMPGTHIVHVASGSWWSATCRDWCCSGEGVAGQTSSTAELARQAVPLLNDKAVAATLGRGIDMLLDGRQPPAGVLVQLANVVLDPIANEYLLRRVAGVDITLASVSALRQASGFFAPPVDVGLLTVLALARLRLGDIQGCWASVVEALEKDPWFLPAHRIGSSLSEVGSWVDETTDL